MSNKRIKARFEKVRAQGRPALVTFVTAGDPDLETSTKILLGLANAGADIIELGMPFSDPMAEGVPIQLSYQRSLEAGHKMAKTLEMVRTFRKQDQDTPIILMGYFNPIYFYGVEPFLKDASQAGVDGLIVVDLPPEADDELCLPAMEVGISFIRLATPTTNGKRLPQVLTNTSGFVYYVSVTGITGADAAKVNDVETAIARIKAATDLPVVVGFGIKTGQQVAEFGAIADGVVVGSAFVSKIADSLDSKNKATKSTVSSVLELTVELANGAKRA